MMDAKDTPVGTEERYSNATHATSLVMVSDRSGAADVLVAAGWCPSRLGSALMRLMSEWDGAAKPRPMSAQAVHALAEKMGRERGRQRPDAVDLRLAKKQAGVWLLHERQLLMGQLKTLGEVREQLCARAAHQSMPQPMDSAIAALVWWLDKACPACVGRKWEAIEGTPMLSGRACLACRASGECPKPHGLDALLLIGYMDDCVIAARVSMCRRLKGWHR